MQDHRPSVLAIAGFDPSGGAGVQADARTIETHGCRALSVVTAITAQTSRDVLGLHPLASAWVSEQLDAVFSETTIQVVKTGMLANAGVIQAVERALAARPELPVVCDPVLAASDGTALLDAVALPELQKLLPRVHLLTPNRAEAEQLTGVSIHSVEDATRAAELLIRRGVRSVLIKGGHWGGEQAIDVLVTAQRRELFAAARIPGATIHGSGCRLAAAIAAGMARGHSVVDAVDRAKRWLTTLIADASASSTLQSGAS